MSQTLVSLVERGHLSSLSIRTVRLLFASVDARYDGLVTWRGGEVDRVLDQRHAEVVGRFAAHLRVLGWQVEIEVTFNEFGDRGSIDILAMRPADRVVLVVEIKTELTSIEATVRRLDVKERLSAKVVASRYDWRPVLVGRLIVLQESSTNRRRVASHAVVLGAALADRGEAVRGWLRKPAGRLSGLVFLSVSNGGATKRGPSGREGS